MIELKDIFSSEISVLDSPITTKEELLRYCAESVCTHPCAQGLKPKQIHKALIQREKEGSTGFGNHIAIPHARVDGMHSFVLFTVRLAQPIDFDSIDDKPVKLVFFLLGPATEVQDHLRLLALLSRRIAHSNLKENILSVASKEGLSEIFNSVADQSSVAVNVPAEQQTAACGLMIITVSSEELLTDMLELMLEYEVDGGVQVFESTGMGHYLSKTPLFGNFVGMLQRNKYHSHTIFATLPQHKIPIVAKEIENISTESKEKNCISYIVIDVGAHYGSVDIL